MQDWFCKSSSSDISFCASDCKNYKCDRNWQGKIMTKMHEKYKKDSKNNYFTYSQADFSDKCSSYVG